jgi:hypothetical protein
VRLLVRTNKLRRRADSHRARGADVHAAPPQCLRWLRGRAFSVDKALALKVSCDAWWRDSRATFCADGDALTHSLLRRRACTRAAHARAAPPRAAPRTAPRTAAHTRARRTRASAARAAAAPSPHPLAFPRFARPSASQQHAARSARLRVPARTDAPADVSCTSRRRHRGLVAHTGRERASRCRHRRFAARLGGARGITRGAAGQLGRRHCRVAERRVDCAVRPSRIQVRALKRCAAPWQRWLVGRGGLACVLLRTATCCSCGELPRRVALGARVVMLRRTAGGLAQRRSAQTRRLACALTEG